METIWTNIIWSQYGAAIDMLENAIRACPDELWSNPSKPPQWISRDVPGFWYVAYHTLFFLDYDFSGPEKEFAPPAPFTLAELDPAGLLPERAYTKDELLAYQTPEQERATIIRCLDTIAAKTGKRPEGWCSPVLAWTQHTDDFLAEQKLLYRADANYIDMPRRIDTKFGPFAHIPHSDFTDQRVLRTAPQIYFDVYKDAFDYLYRDEPMALLELVLHCHWGGRPLMTAVADRLFTYFRQFPDVWFARHRELARWALDADPEQSTYQRRFFT